MSSHLARRLAPALALPVLLCAGAALAQDAAEPKLDTGNTAWLLTSSALVLMMTLPGLALFYAGLVRAKNTLSLFMQCLVSAGVVGVLWILIGYTLAFGTGKPHRGTRERACRCPPERCGARTASRVSL